MTSKTRNPSEIGAAIGYLSNFIGTLKESLIEAGGKPEMLYFATSDYAKPMMDLLAKTIVESNLWKVPKSHILEEVRNASNAHELEYNLERNWAYYSTLAKWLTTLDFCDDVAHNREIEGDGLIPEEIREIIRGGKIRCAGDTLEWNGRKYVVTQIDLPDKNGGITEYLQLAPAEWIDLDN